MCLDCRPRLRTSTLKPGFPDVDGNDAMSLRIPLLLALAVLAAAAVSFLPATSARAASLSGWNLGEQRAVREAGVLHNLDDQAFHGERPLSGHQLPEALAALAARLGCRARRRVWRAKRFSWERRVL
jgi:hypothetical protein